MILDMFSAFGRNKTLVKQLLIREISSRYRGSVLGIIWSLVTPILMLCIYTFVFKYIFNARWQMPSAEGEVLNFAMVLFLGLIIHGMIADILTRSSGLMLENVNFVKKVIFPLEILPWVVLLSTLFNFCIGFCLLLGFVYIELDHIPVTTLLIPIILAPYVMMLLGLSWTLAALGVYVRDIKQLSGTLATLLLFLSPVFYSITILPETLQRLILINPIAVIVEASRSAVIYGEHPDYAILVIYSLLALIVSLVGFTLFQRMRKGFADVL
ncbi:MAG: ABC transporter permease [Crocinitomicaceae bacterium]|nr:ABC transporter permease [Crocinitomicaceae bacterium]